MATTIPEILITKLVKGEKISEGELAWVRKVGDESRKNAAIGWPIFAVAMLVICVLAL